MTKQTTILLGSILLLTAAMASAQTSQKVIVNVPFSFTAGSHALPAGNYTIELDREESAMILRHETQSGKTEAVIITANNGGQPADWDKAYAIFQRYGSQYFLAKVWREGVGQTLAPGRRERELAEQHRNSEVTQITAQLSEQ